MKHILLCLALTAIFSHHLSAEEFPAPTVVFDEKMAGYQNIRIPTICRTPQGTLLAFAEGREGGDAGDVDIILRRSTDNGRTWGDIQVLWNDGKNTCGSPTAVVDETTGFIWLIGHWSIGTDDERKLMDGTASRPREVYVMHSEDDGLTWSTPLLQPHLTKPEWGWYATGPCNGIQLTLGPHAGRLIIPANHSILVPADSEIKGAARYRAHLIYSDDHGQTWHLGGIHEPLTNESTIAELADGSIMQNMRSYHGKGGRAVAVSHDGGETFGECFIDETLRSPVCQASILRYSPDVLLFSAPYGNTRNDLSVWLSTDDGKTWPVRKQIHSGPSAYSNLVALPDGNVGLLFECGERHASQRSVFVTFPLDEVNR